MSDLTYILICASTLLLHYALGSNCDYLGIRLYENLGCKPSNFDKSCPSSFECQLKPPNSNQCIVQNNIYNQKDAISKNTLGYSCEFGCFCNL